MNEETNASVETSVDEFDAGWADEGFQPDYTNYEPDEAAEDGEKTDEAESNTKSEEVTDSENQTDRSDSGGGVSEEKKPEEAEEAFELNYMGNKETVGRNEVVSLAQKGKDYDRIHGKLDEANSELETLRKQKQEYEKYSAFLTKLASQSGQDVQSLIDTVTAKMLVDEEAAKGNQITEEIALERVKLNREREEFEAQKAKGAEKAAKQDNANAAEPEKDTAKAKRQDEFLAFSREYPNVKPEEIPQEVWKDFNAGSSLVGAYAKYENKQLKAQLEAEKQNNKNRERSTGSRTNAGAGKQKDAFDLGWDID